MREFKSEAEEKAYWAGLIIKFFLSTAPIEYAETEEERERIEAINANYWSNVYKEEFGEDIKE